MKKLAEIMFKILFLCSFLSATTYSIGNKFKFESRVTWCKDQKYCACD
ncbi:hypothetical protein MNBD_GAMMA12-652 [hydrothermal vent metagenome]|uniref:Uncharacterized protein n=1 Tax=hydrothermal vent metagenome TaxID=652676 RepID=A0A3B0Y8F4_9ZZZZ